MKVLMIAGSDNFAISNIIASGIFGKAIPAEQVQETLDIPEIKPNMKNYPLVAVNPHFEVLDSKINRKSKRRRARKY